MGSDRRFSSSDESLLLLLLLLLSLSLSLLLLLRLRFRLWLPSAARTSTTPSSSELLWEGILLSMPCAHRVNLCKPMLLLGLQLVLLLRFNG